MTRTRTVQLALGLVCILGAGGVSAATLHVGSGQTYATIQAAINAAATGDVVVVAEGTYKENINFGGKAIRVRSSNPLSPTVVAATVINGNQAGSVVTFNSGETRKSVLDGFTITNGSGTVQGALTEGGGVYCVNSSSPTLINNLISGNTAYDGGGMNCYGGTGILVRNTISGNSAENGGGIFVDSSTLTLSNNTISNNTASYEGGGLDFEGASAGGPPTLAHNVISGNSGSGVFSEGESPILTNDTISGNSGSGVELAASSSVLKNTIVTFNEQGGLCIDGIVSNSNPVITYCDFWGNTGGNYVGWPGQGGKNGNLDKNPLFEDAAAGNFYLKSKYGRWAPMRKTWVIDTVQSPCIDAGNPKAAYNLEPAPNGGRINMGFEGDTIYASKSPSTTASAAAALTVSAAAVSTSGGSAQIVVTLASAASVEATVLNVAGREVAVLPEQDLAAGVSTMLWDGRSTLGTKVPAGQYLVRLTARTPDGGQAQTVVALELRR